ncbi:MAG: hypothetical protein ACKOGN_02000 [Gammaproteobacteria bacterium]
MSSTLAFKIILVPALIGHITLAGRRWGRGFAGLVLCILALSFALATLLAFVTRAAFRPRV